MRSVRRRAFVSCSAIVANARAHGADGDVRSIVADLRADAYGHGLLPVAHALAETGVAALLVSTSDELSLLNADGIDIPIFVQTVNPSASALTVVGTGLFGLSATNRAERPALRLVAEILSVKQVPVGRGVSYGYTYRTAHPTTLILAGLGYADGLPRLASNRAPVLVGTKKSKVTGLVAMDQFVVDIGDAQAAVGEPVVLFGDPDLDEPTVLDWATATGLRPEVIVAGLGTRVTRLYEES